MMKAADDMLEAAPQGFIQILRTYAPGAVSETTRAQPRRRAVYGAQVRRSEGVTTRIPEAARVGMRSAAFFETMDSTEEVAQFLRELDMAPYIASFRANGVTGNTLMSLNSIELRETLGVQKLRDRRMLMDAIMYLSEALGEDARRSLPEDGRILTHLSNEITFLAWLRWSVVLQTLAVANLRLISLKSDRNKLEVTALSTIVSLIAVAALLYAFHRYYWMHRMVETPGNFFSPENVRLTLPAIAVLCTGVILVYTLMANDTEEAALLALLTA